MIIDITNRQSGKTTRLIEYALYKLEEGFAINIVSYKSLHTLEIKNKIKSKSSLSLSVLKGKIFTSTKMITLPGVINLVDEFDRIDDKNLFLDEMAYYCSTISSFPEAGSIRYQLIEKFHQNIKNSSTLQQTINLIRKEIQNESKN